MSARPDGCASCGGEKPSPRHTYCDQCKTQRRRAATGPKISSSKRGYNAQHKRLRAQWEPKVQRGDVDCHATRCLEPQRRITPGERWDLGHTSDRTAWTGPEHERCNRSDGATRGNHKRKTDAKNDAPPPAPPAPTLTLRDW